MRNRFSNTTKTWLLVIFAVVAILYAVLPYAGHKEKGIVDLPAEKYNYLPFADLQSTL